MQGNTGAGAGDGNKRLLADKDRRFSSLISVRLNELVTLNMILDRIATVFATTRLPPPLRLFRGQQEAIAGEVISLENTPPAGQRLTVIGFSEFARRLQADEAAFVRWFKEIKSALETWTTGDNTVRPRLTLIQNSLMDLIEFFGPQQQRFPRHLTRIRQR